MACKMRLSNTAVIPWINNAAGSADVAKGDLVHMGNNQFGVAVDAIEFGATGQLIIHGYFDNVSVLVSSAVTVGAALANNDAAIETADNVVIAVTAAESAVKTVPNMFAAAAITAATAAQTISVILK